MTRLQQNSEIQELSMRLQSQEPKERETAYNRLITLEAQNADCSSAYPALIGYRPMEETKYIRTRRFIGVLNEKYMDVIPNMADNVTAMLLNEYERPDPQLKGIIVRQIGRLVNDSNIDKLIPVVMRACSSDDPYVRKASALAILSIHQARSSFIEKFNRKRRY